MSDRSTAAAYARRCDAVSAIRHPETPLV